MKTRHVRTFLVLAIAGIPGLGCGALGARSDPGAARYFSLDRGPERPVAVAAGDPGTRPEPADLRLGRVTGSPHLEERVVFRSSAYEIGYYREVRWTEPPERFLERMLARDLFEDRGLRQVVSGPGPTLDVTLSVFDVLEGPPHVARAQVTASLHDEHRVFWQQTVTVDRPVVEIKDGDRAVERVQALGEAMREAGEDVADQVARELDKPR